MIKFGTWVSAIFAVTVLAVPAQPADENELIAEEGALEIVLLRQHDVQKDLKLTDVHGKKIHEFATQQWTKVKEIHKLPKGEQDAKYDVLTKENDKFLSDILSPEQRKRLDQIGMQVAGLLWAGRSETASALKLTSDQKKKLQELHKEAHKDAVAILKEAKDEDAKHEELKKLHETNRKRLMELLSPEQKETWKVLAGPEFKGELHFSSPKKD
jgi:Spy/CpxP family protein refolding chaperone